MRWRRKGWDRLSPLGSERCAAQLHWLVAPKITIFAPAAFLRAPWCDRLWHSTAPLPLVFLFATLFFYFYFAVAAFCPPSLSPLFGSALLLATSLLPPSLPLHPSTRQQPFPPCAACKLLSPTGEGILPQLQRQQPGHRPLSRIWNQRCIRLSPLYFPSVSSNVYRLPQTISTANN